MWWQSRTVLDLFFACGEKCTGRLVLVQRSITCARVRIGLFCASRNKEAQQTKNVTMVCQSGMRQYRYRYRFCTGTGTGILWQDSFPSPMGKFMYLLRITGYCRYRYWL